MEDRVTTPPEVQPYLEVLGAELAIRFFLEFGGTGLYMPTRATRRGSDIANFLGTEMALALGKKLGSGTIKIPLAKRWIAQYLRIEKGESISKICRTIHMTETTVRGYVQGRRADRQLSFDM